MSTELPETPVLSYYFPRGDGESNQTNTFFAANIIEAASAAWTESLRKYWRNKGKMILVRPQ